MSMMQFSETREADAFERRRALRTIEDMSIAMIAVMKRHVDGPQPIEVGSRYGCTILALRARELLTVDGFKVPRCTRPTAFGRRVIAEMLASEADAVLEVMGG